ncbi:MAG: glycoside hydrolase family 31 protein [Oscillospiraceae bacterium]|jgi:alpha-glucosidase (family GH31 glycosyl hydrolase)|nr:glycoside hydrolase family 31 protein [Oscillospiraceae bacterium]
MSYFENQYALPLSPAPQDAATTVLGNVRVQVLGNRLVRVEYSKSGTFTDAATQVVWHRDWTDNVNSNVRKVGGKILVETDKIRLTLRAKDAKFLRVDFKETGTSVHKDVREGNLLGTTRTLDQTIGETALGDGIVSRAGLAVLDDSKSLTIDAHSHLAPRAVKGTDKYYFAYGHDYRAAVQDYYRLTGEVPLIPRFALGNWWSRYKAYTQQEYLDLMARFDKEQIPITVATVDMDWHWVDLKKHFSKEQTRIQDPARKGVFQWGGSGWTGYSWDTELFPDWKDFLRTLQAQGRFVTLNLHPADGVRAFEDPYPAMAEAMGIDPATGKQVNFDITDPNFVTNYFRHLHHPLEKAGVDFWWIDWQQGKKTKIPGLDPLWALNHYHYLDSFSGKEADADAPAPEHAKRHLILSRYAGPGSHRYPLGFSGDTMINWSCLRFQPYFTANAANIGYTWWSHDIGGHHMGSKDDELYLRWVQFAVFNPIMRLHSTSNEFMGKEPWKYRPDVYAQTVELLRLRHRLIPYIYTENARNHREGIALCEPLYYRHPEYDEAYKYGNEYYFGRQLLAAPITEKLDKNSALASVKLWLPEGRWTDIFNGRVYQGGRELTVCRDLTSTPVFAKAGTIVPLSTDGTDNNWRNPAALELWIWRGNGEYTLYEDDGETDAHKRGYYAQTQYTLSETAGNLSLTIADKTPESAPADWALWRAENLPTKRSYRLSFKDVVDAREISATVNGETVDVTRLDGETLTLALGGIAPTDTVELTLTGTVKIRKQATKEALIEQITKFQCEVFYKRQTWDAFVQNPTAEDIPGGERYIAALKEIIELAE